MERQNWPYHVATVYGFRFSKSLRRASDWGAEAHEWIAVQRFILVMLRAIRGERGTGRYRHADAENGVIDPRSSKILPEAVVLMADAPFEAQG